MIPDLQISMHQSFVKLSAIGVFMPFWAENDHINAWPECFLIRSLFYQSFPYFSIYCMAVANFSMVSFEAESSFYLALRLHLHLNLSLKKQLFCNFKPTEWTGWNSSCPEIYPVKAQGMYRKYCIMQPPGLTFLWAVAPQSWPSHLYPGN